MQCLELHMLSNSSILITGGTGSFGNTFVPMTLAKYNPRRLVIYSRDEMKQWEKAKLYGYAQQWQDELARLVPLGFITDPSEVGGWPEYKGAPYQDTDGDGLPDAWEKQHRLDPSHSSHSSQDTDGDGYTDIEEFLNGTDPQKAVNYTDIANNK